MVANYTSIVALFVMVIVAIAVVFVLWTKKLRETIFKLRRDVNDLETEMRYTQNELMALLIKDDARKELYEFLKKEYENEQSRIDSGNI